MAIVKGLLAPGVGFEPTSPLRDTGLASQPPTRLGYPGVYLKRGKRGLNILACRWCGSPNEVSGPYHRPLGEPASIPLSCERCCPSLGLLPSGPNPVHPMCRKLIPPDELTPLQHPHRARLLRRQPQVLWLVPPPPKVTGSTMTTVCSGEEAEPSSPPCRTISIIQRGDL